MLADAFDGGGATLADGAGQLAIGQDCDQGGLLTGRRHPVAGPRAAEFDGDPFGVGVDVGVRGGAGSVGSTREDQVPVLDDDELGGAESERHSDHGAFVPLGDGADERRRAECPEGDAGELETDGFGERAAPVEAFARHGGGHDGNLSVGAGRLRVAQRDVVDGGAVDGHRELAGHLEADHARKLVGGQAAGAGGEAKTLQNDVGAAHGEDQMAAGDASGVELLLDPGAQGVGFVLGDLLGSDGGEPGAEGDPAAGDLRAERSEPVRIQVENCDELLPCHAFGSFRRFWRSRPDRFGRADQRPPPVVQRPSRLSLGAAAGATGSEAGGSDGPESAGAAEPTPD
jgi:hypothetical protein